MAEGEVMPAVACFADIATDPRPDLPQFKVIFGHPGPVEYVSRHPGVGLEPYR